MLASSTALPAQPQRVVSVNLCTDQMLVALLPTARIASLSRLAMDTGISQLDQGRMQALSEVPLNAGMAEEILPLRPDLVIAGRYSAQPTVELLRRLAVPVLSLDISRSLADIRLRLRRVGEALGADAHAETLIAQFDARLVALRVADDAPRPLAVYLQPNGYTAGRNSLVDDIMRNAGLRNLGAELGIQGHGKVSLEQVLMAKPELLIIDQHDPRYPSLATGFLSHPAIQALARRIPQLIIPPRLWICGLPRTLDALQRLTRARRQLLDANTNATHPGKTPSSHHEN